jgi:hypothetical protein
MENACLLAQLGCGSRSHRTVLCALLHASQKQRLLDKHMHGAGESLLRLTLPPAHTICAAAAAAAAAGSRTPRAATCQSHTKEVSPLLAGCEHAYVGMYKHMLGGRCEVVMSADVRAVTAES